MIGYKKVVCLREIQVCVYFTFINNCFITKISRNTIPLPREAFDNWKNQIGLRCSWNCLTQVQWFTTIHCTSKIPCVFSKTPWLLVLIQKLLVELYTFPNLVCISARDVIVTYVAQKKTDGFIYSLRAGNEDTYKLTLLISYPSFSIYHFHQLPSPYLRWEIMMIMIEIAGNKSIGAKHNIRIFLRLTVLYNTIWIYFDELFKWLTEIPLAFTCIRSTQTTSHIWW